MNRDPVVLPIDSQRCSIYFGKSSSTTRLVCNFKCAVLFFCNLGKQLIDNQTTFNIKMEGHTSNWHEQETGIRQRCSVSPYVFLIVTTTLFQDIHQQHPQNSKTLRVYDTHFDEIIHADDTICISTDTTSFNLFSKDIEQRRERRWL